MKKTLSIILSIVMLFSIVSTASISSFATTVYNEYEQNNTYSTANSVSVDSEIHGTISSSNDIDYYKITPSSNGKLSISFLHTYANSYDDWDIYVYKYSDGSYEEISYENIDLNANEKINLPYVGAVANNIYYIKVERCCSGVVGKSYTIQTSFASSNYYEKEFNETYATATSMALNKTYNGVINSSSDYDYYKIVTNANGKLSISFKHTYVNSYDDWDVYVYRYSDGEYREICYANIDLNANEKITLPYIGAVSNGIYYVVVNRCCSGVVGKNYSISTSFTESNYYEKEFNDVYSTATKISLNQTYNGVLNSSSDNDYYKIVAPFSGNVSITFTHDTIDSYDDWDVYVYAYYDGQYNQLSYTNIDLNSSQKTKLPTLSMVKGRAYYIRVERCCSGVVGRNYSIYCGVNIAKPSSLKVSTRNTTSLKLSWNKVSGASGYQLQKKSGDTYKTITTTTSTSATVKNLSSATSYTFRVRAYKTIDGKKYYSSWTTLTTPTKPGKVSIKTPSTNGKHQIVAKWSKVTRASGYQVQYCKNSSCSNVVATKTVSGGSKTSYTGNNFTKGRKYYVRIRAYKTVNGNKYYGAWSNVKSITCK